ncbi:hypothetical protein HY992_03900 [Candidatus Micrarchaeota archaeon]|nr:hypothetical protein [Candidatus Micrarchaeota archaeon]
MNFFEEVRKEKKLITLLVLSLILGFIPIEGVKTISVLLLALILIVWGYKFMQADLREKNEAWRQAAEKIGLEFTPGSIACYPSMHGERNGRRLKATMVSGRKGSAMQNETHFVVEVELHKHVPVEAEIRRERNSFYLNALFSRVGVKMMEFKPKEGNCFAQANNVEKTKELLGKIENEVSMLFEEKEIGFFAVSTDKIIVGKRKRDGLNASAPDVELAKRAVGIAEKMDGGQNTKFCPVCK